ncbi:MAG: hypothetical protein IT236_13265 [Bacteroidia bacterium]|nr:hypothetical protein [Bacteroidia bacterium]
MKKKSSYLKVSSILILTLLLIASSCKDSNQDIFFDFFKFSPPPDVTDFHYFAEEGFDSDYWIAFECDSTTVKKIVTSLNLVKGKEETYGLMGGLNFKPTLWWDYNFIKESVPHTKVVYSSHYFLWYDKAKRKAYFLLYDT